MPPVAAWEASWAPGLVVCVRLEAGDLEFGAGLTPDQLKWACAAVAWHVGGTRAGDPEFERLFPASGAVQPSR